MLNPYVDEGDAMYKKMLIPTDGSDLSRSAALAGVEFARQLGAEILGVFVAPEFPYPIYVDVLPSSYMSDPDYQNSMRHAGESYLKIVQDAAQAAGLVFASRVVFSDLTAKAIVHAAEEEHCDMIFMGSHGRSGLGQLLLGSVTSKVLSSCEIPVLVHRIKKHAH
jgi:nucleotide-binding universal stress UspA family protein